MLRKLSFFLAVVIVVLMAITTGSAMQEEERDACIDRINDFFDCIDENDWNNYPNFFAPTVRENNRSFVDNAEYVNNGVGILAISSAEVLGITPTSDMNYFVYPELEGFYNSPSTIRCYKVEVNETTWVNSNYYPNGTVNHLVIMVYENGEWWIGQTAILTETNMRPGWGFYDYSPRPTTITVMDENGTISTVSFYDFLFNVMCNEIGNEGGFSTDAFKANAMAIKMLGWWATYMHPYSSYGCDLIYGFVAYMSVNNAGTTGRNRVASAIRNTCKYYTVSSSGSGGKLFSHNYSAGSYNSNGQGGGRLYQNGSDYLSDTYNYDWKDILHYYYDNSTYNHPNVGTIQIVSSSHTYSGYQSDISQHWRVCTFCGYETTHTDHTWVNHGDYDRCSVCGRKIYYR